MLLQLLVRDAFHFDVGQVRRRLLTHEDRRYFHMHAILGATCLVHFLYQVVRMFTEPAYNILEHPWMPLLIVPHAALNLSSFEFALSGLRNLKYNIIWPEMRWHSMIFAYRSILCLLIAYATARVRLGETTAAMLRAAVVFSTFVGADVVTSALRSRSTTTMRDNPWPEYVPRAYASWHNVAYSMAQFAATVVCLSGHPNIVFLTLIAIQTAPFGMTLVKKGVIRSLGWHVSYSAAIAVPLAYQHFFLAAAAPTRSHKYLPAAVVISDGFAAVLLVTLMRLGLRVNKYVTWAAVAFFFEHRRLTEASD